MPKITKQIEVFGTLDTSAHPARIKDNSLVKRENFRYQAGDYGIIVYRNGIQKYNSNQVAGGSFPILAMFEARLSSGTNYLMIVVSNTSSSKVRRITDPYTGAATDVSSTSADENYPLRFAQLKDTVYRANRGDGAAANYVTNFTYDLEIGCPPCENSSIVAVDTGTAGNLNGGYRYVVTFIYEGNMESGITTGDDAFGGLTSVTVTNKKVQLTVIPLGSARVTARRIYRTIASGLLTFKYVGTLPDNVSTVFDDNVPDAELGDERELKDFFTFEKPYKSKYNNVHGNRMIQGYLKENHTDAMDMVNGDLSLINGSLDTAAIYKYRIFKILANVTEVDGKQKFVLSKPVELSITTTDASNDGVRITFPAAEIADEWYRGVTIMRTEGGDSVFYHLTTQATVPATYDDTASDATLTANSNLSAFFEIPQVASDIFPSRISVSKVDEFGFTQPDLIETTIEIGQSDDQVITGLWSEEYALRAFRDRSIYRIDTTPDSVGFWKATPVVQGIGSDAGMQCKTPDGYVFVKTSSTTKDKMLVYEWTQGQPRVCSIKIQGIINGLNAITVRGITYNSNSNKVIIVLYDGSIHYWYEYDLNLRDENGFGEWYTMLNATDINLRSVIKTVAYDLLFASGIGYLNSELSSSNQDDIAGSNTSYIGLFKTKKFEFTEGDLMPRRLKMITEGSTSANMTLKYAVDNGIQTSKTLTNAMINGINRVDHTDFSSANDRAYRNIDFQLEFAGGAASLKIHNVVLDMDIKHANSKGR